MDPQTTTTSAAPPARRLPAAPDAGDATARRYAWGAVNWSLAAVAAAGLAVSFIFAPDDLPYLPLCSFRHTTGLSCPGCGLTRSVCAISHGGFARAWHENPFGYVFYAIGVFVVLRPLLVLASRRYAAWEERLTSSWLAVAAPVSLMLGLLIFGIVRLCLEWTAR